MSLDQNASIPVDRHVFQFAERWYHFRSKRYEDIAEKFRALWGERAGWAHTVRHISFSTCYLTCQILFYADLRSFQKYDPNVEYSPNQAAEKVAGVKRSRSVSPEDTLAA